MKKFRLAVAVALVASFSMLASSSAQAQNYPVVTVNVSERSVVGGEDILIEATVSPSTIDCQWTLTFLGQERTGSGNSISETFSTPEVNSETQVEAVAVCTYDDGANLSGSGSSRTAGASLATVETTATGTGTQTLLPEDDDGDEDGDGDGDGGGDGDGDGDNGGLLPNTGGERLAWLIIGAMLVLVGGGVYMASRQRDA
jgi:LPXTG-motif cell wall-anchored protein